MMGKRPLPVDEKQREIFRESLGTSLAVEAGAGTGKTSLLVDRLIGLAYHSSISLSRIAAITFTEKAAGELIDRVRQGLELRLSASSSPEESKKYGDILNEIDVASISTIHGLASSIVHDRAIQAGIDPEFGHIEPDEEKRMVQEAFFRALNRSDPQRDRWLSRFTALGGRVNSLIDTAAALFDKLHILRELSENADQLDILTRVVALHQKVDRLFNFASEHCLDHSDLGFISVSELHQSYPETTEIELDIFWKWLTQIASLKKNSGAQPNWDTNESLKEFKADMDLLKISASEVLAMARRETMENLLVWIRKVLDQAQRQKISLGKIGFSDQLTMARDLLGNADIRAEFARRYVRVLIDEFQDTDPLQAEIALRIAAVHSEVTSVYELPLEQGKLSVVGDPKQSIYRFRGADLKTYKLASDQIVKTGSFVRIRQNFRSSKGIISFVNAFFSSLWDAVDSTGFTYSEIAADPNRRQPIPQPSVVLLQPNAKQADEKMKVDDLRSAEARAIASIIQQSQHNSAWTVCDPQDNRLRPIRFGDFALLFPTTTKIDIYTTQLSKSGIPFQIEGGKNFFNSQLATEFYSCLSAIDNPADRLQVIAALRSRFFGVNDRDIFLWQNQLKGRMDYRQISAAISDGIKPSLKLLRQLHEQRHELPADQLIVAFFSLTKALPLALSIRNSWSDLAALDRFQEHADSWSRDHNEGLTGFRRYLRNLMNKGDDKGSARSMPGQDGVRLMTIHAAKGLEFPAVVLANLFKPKSISPLIISDYTNRQFEVRFGSAKTGIFETAGYASKFESYKQEETAEKMRLLYVAMTRARDHLVIPRFVEMDKDGKPTALYQEWLSEFLTDDNNESPDGNKLWRDYVSMISDVIPISTSGMKNEEVNMTPEDAWNELEEWHTDRQRRLSEAIDRLPTRLTPSQLQIDIRSGKSAASAQPEDAKYAQSFGKAFHLYMARCLLSDVIDRELATQLAQEYDLDVSQFSPMLSQCLISALWREIIHSRRIWRELPVIARIDSARVQGIADVVIQNEAGLYHIVDYKTSATKTDEHRAQLQIYAAAVAASTGGSIASARIYYAAMGDIVEVKLQVTG